MRVWTLLGLHIALVCVTGFLLKWDFLERKTATEIIKAEEARSQPASILIALSGSQVALKYEVFARSPRETHWLAQLGEDDIIQKCKTESSNVSSFYGAY